jgi:hypothetical protein
MFSTSTCKSRVEDLLLNIKSKVHHIRDDVHRIRDT